MRAIWKGAVSFGLIAGCHESTVSFGLVSIGVKMYSATEERDISFHQVRRTDGSRIRYRRVAEADGEEVAYSDIAKGYSLPSGDTIVLTDEDLADLPLPSTRVVDVLQFVPAEQVDPIYFARSYYLEPENQAVKPYLLLREALDESGMYGLVKVAIRNREQLATLRVRDGVIVLETMIWPDEVREAAFAFLDENVDLRPQERAMAESLVASMAGDFDPDVYSDDYREALQQVIEAKIEGREVIETPQAEPTAGNVVDLMAALRASVEAAKRGRGETATTPAKTEPAKTTTAKTSAKTAPAKKASARKAPAGKTAAKKAPAKKAPAKATTAKSGTSTRKATARRRSA